MLSQPYHTSQIRPQIAGLLCRLHARNGLQTCQEVIHVISNLRLFNQQKLAACCLVLACLIAFVQAQGKLQINARTSNLHCSSKRTKAHNTNYCDQFVTVNKKWRSTNGGGQAARQEGDNFRRQHRDRLCLQWKIISNKIKIVQKN